MKIPYMLVLAALLATPLSAAAEENSVSTGLKLDLLVPTGRVSTTYAVAAELRWRLPFHGKRLALAGDVGWHPSGGEGQQVDPQQGPYRFEWSAHTLPVFLGLEYLPPLPELVPGLRPFGEAGFAMAWLWTEATSTNADGHVFSSEHPDSGFATGLYLGAGAVYRLGPGDLVGQYRWTGLYSDMDKPWINRESGDLGASNLYAGYRLLF